MTFQSVHILNGDQSSKQALSRCHDFTDALESVVHILVYIFMEYAGPGDQYRIDPNKRCPLIREYESTAYQSASAKEKILNGRMFSKEKGNNKLTSYFDHHIFKSLLVELASVIWPYSSLKGPMTGK